MTRYLKNLITIDMVLTALVGLVCFLSVRELNAMQSDIDSLKVAKEVISLKVERVKTSEEDHYESLKNSIDDLKDWLKKR